MDVIVTVRFRVNNLFDERDLAAEPERTTLDFVQRWLADGYDLREQDEFEVVAVDTAPPPAGTA